MTGLPTTWLDAEWLEGKEGSEKTTLIRYADEDRRLRIVRSPEQPYIFFEKAERERALKHLKKWRASLVKGDFISWTGKPLDSAELQIPSHVHQRTRGDEGSRGLRDDLEAVDIETFESDIPFIGRLMVDFGIKQCAIKHRCYADIEVKAIEGFPDPEKAPYQLMCVSLVGDDGKSWFICDDDEVEIYAQLTKALSKTYTLITGWNWNKFDSKYLRRRAKVVGAKFRFFPLQEIDAMQNYRKITIWGFTGASYRLENVAKRHLGIDIESMKNLMDAQRLWKSFLGDRKELREYNMEDAEIVLKLDKLLHLCEPYIDLAQSYPILIREAPFMTMVWEHLMLQKLHDGNPRICLPKRIYREESLKGGHVWDPHAGVHRAVLSMDYASLYPSIMESFRLSPETVKLYRTWKQSGKAMDDWIEEVRKGIAA